MKEEVKIKCDDKDKELLKYIELNKKELHYMMIKNFEDSQLWCPRNEKIFGEQK